MTFDPRRSELLHELSRETAPSDGPAAARARRERTVAHLRGLQARAAVRREMHTSWRNRWLVAAALLIPSGALGASLLSWSPFVRSTRVEPIVSPATNVASHRPRRTPVADRGADPAIEVAATIAAAGPSTGALEARFASPAPSGVPTRPAHDGAATKPSRESSTLADENRLMLSALAAARSGENGRAVHLFTELLTRHPGSPLAQNAEVERFRALLRGGDEQSAARHARAYLDRYPNGMAADEARRVASSGRDSRDARPL